MAARKKAGGCCARAPFFLKMASKLQGGYECSFVKPVHDDLQSECSICLHVLREPYLVGCCGYRFCRTCIEPLQKKSRHCPLCKETFTSFPDKQLERILNEKLVYCPHKETGCKWEGKLAALEGHLNPKPAGSVAGCYHHKEMCCPHCNTRYFFPDHLKTCPSKIVICTYCKGHADTALRVKSTHHNECPMYPVDCPNDCGAKPFRKDIHDHLDFVCPLTVVKCDLACAGCDAELRRKDMKEHLDSSSSEHLQMAKLKITALTQRIDEEAMKPIKFLSVTNLNWNTDESMLRSVFGQFGKVADVHYNEDFDPELATIQYVDEDSARRALSRSRGIGINLKSNRLCLSPVF